MAIVSPVGKYSRNDVRVIQLLARHLGDVSDGLKPTNMLLATTLSDSEVAVLIEALEMKLEDKEFRLASALVDAVGNREFEQIRELYLSGRTRRQHSRALASKQHAEFLARLGLTSQRQVSYYAPAERMSYEYFLRMERRSLEALGLSTRVIDLCLRYLRLYADEVEGVRDQRVRLSPNFLLSSMEIAKSTLLKLSKVDDVIVDGGQLAGLLVVVVNVGVLYTTRDWSVTGTMSTIAGGLATMAPNRRP